MVRKLDLLAFALVLHRWSDAGDIELEMSRAESPGSVPVRADRRGRVDEPTPAADH
jgi:hypothetical protein